VQFEVHKLPCYFYRICADFTSKNKFFILKILELMEKIEQRESVATKPPVNG